MAEAAWSTALYAPLPLSGTQLRTRFLRIRKGSRNDKLRCKLFASTLVSTQYEALSYTWGTDAHVNLVSVNGTIVGVTRNLYSALLALREPDKNRVIWVDALCINQADVRERSHQVQQMGDIYRCAHQVIIWIGEASGNSNVLFRHIRMLDEPSATNQLLGAGRLSDARPGGEILSKHNSAWRPGNTRQMIDHMDGRRYWTRVWIVQEIAQAKSNPLVMCGNESIEWSKLVDYAATTDGMQQIKLLQAIRDRARTPPRLRLNGDQVPNSFEVRASYADDLFYLLDKTRDFDATDPRDKVFALLSMTRGLSAQVAVADYNQSVERVFIDLAETAVNRSLSLDITSYKAPATPSDLESTTLRLPSWVPDFSRKGASPMPAFDGISASKYRSKVRHPEYHEVLELKLRSTLFIKDRGGRKILNAKGLCIALVNCTTTTESIFSQVASLSGTLDVTDQGPRQSSWQQHFKEQYKAQMHSRCEQWLSEQCWLWWSLYYIETSLNTPEPQDVEHLAEVIFLFHTRIHRGNKACCPADFARPCTRASLRYMLKQKLDLARFLRARYLPEEATGDQLQDPYARKSQFPMSALFQAALKAAKQRQTPGDHVAGPLLDSIPRDLRTFDDLRFSPRFDKPLRSGLESCIESLKLQKPPCPWPRDGALATEALGQVASCDQFFEDIMSYKMLTTDAGYLGFVNAELDIQRLDKIVLFENTASLKVVRELPGDDRRGPGFELIGDVYLHWPDLEPRWAETDLEVHWYNYTIV